MITKVDIPGYGLFNSYLWDTEVGKDQSFKRLNIIYGRNYSGKTTLARIFKCMEDQLMHRNYQNCTFKITLSNGSIIRPNNLEDFGANFKLRVYNTDFVRENLSWLHDDEGQIKPFTILGAKNIEIDKQIKLLEEELGSMESQSGLIYDLSALTKNAQEMRKKINDRRDSLDEKLRRRANEKIKVDPNLFLASAAKRTYTITDINNDIVKIGKNLSAYQLKDEDIDIRKKLLKEIPMDDIEPLLEFKPKFANYITTCQEILNRQIKPSQPIADLINNNLLQEWVRQGIDKHKDQREVCGFCGSMLPRDLWDRLDAHFSKESEVLRADIKLKIDNLLEAKKALMSFVTLQKENFYTTLQPKFIAIHKEWLTSSKTYGESIEQIVFELKERERDIFKARHLPEITDVSESVSEVIKSFNSLIGDHNRKTSSLAKDQLTARAELRYADIAIFLDAIGYLTESDAIILADQKCKIAENGLKPFFEKVEEVREAKRQLEAQAKDESKGAELVNQHLSHYFGHNELKLVAEGVSPNILFKIQREGVTATNLSEGECSLISFCYFIAKMQDELKDHINSSKLIIYIDDPISSLDSNHIFFMFSLIESVIAGPKKYCQLFISTHNLDFLKYLKTLTHIKEKKDGKDKPDLKYFIIERRNKNNTVLKPAPEYLKEYVTEFNYLFDQILKCAEGKEEDIASNYQYSFGNNMRKFLETYLFYKYPSHKLSPDQRINKYFENDSVTKTLVKRLTHEYSHIGAQFERGMEPVEVAEISKVAKAVLSKIKTEDPDQYGALIESVT